VTFVSAFLAVFVFGALAQTPSAPVVIKDECTWVPSLEFSPNAGELARFCFGYAVALYDTTNYRRARKFLTTRWLLRSGFSRHARGGMTH
jgi:hypothetical protein